MKNMFLSLIGIFFFIGCIYLFLAQPASPKFQENIGHPRETLIQIGDSSIIAEIADTEDSRVQGLSGREALGERRGMLFVFDISAKQGIWMKDMNFPLDIVWLNQEKRVVDMKKSADPSTYPEVFYPEEKAMYVLELNAGVLESLSIDTGDILYFDY